MLEDIQAAIPLGFFLAFMIGPVFFILLETSVIKGFRAAVAFDLGVVFSDILFILLAYFSSYQLLENLSNQPGLYVFGGTLLAAYGTIVFLKKTKVPHDRSTITPEKANYLELFMKGFFLNAINVGVLVFWLGLIIVIGPNLDGDPKRFLLFFSTLLTAYFITDLLKISVANRFKSLLTGKGIVIVNSIISLILIVSGIVLIIKGS